MFAILKKSLPNSTLLLLVFSLSLALFNKKGFALLDPDLGWHLRTAKDWLENGLNPYVDNYSHALSSFPWINYELVAELVMYYLYKNLGLYGLNFVAALVASLFLTCHVYLTKINFSVKNTTMLIYGWVFLIGLSPSYGIRVTSFSIWFHVILFWILFFYLKGLKTTRKYLVWSIVTVLTFWLWANTHPSFFVGLLVLLGCLIYRSARNKSFEKRGYVVLVASILVTLLNLNFVNLWVEIVKYFSPQGIYNLLYIQEWQSMLPENNYFEVAPIFFILIILVQNNKYFLKTNPFLFAVSLLFVISVFKARRNVPISMVWALPIVLGYLETTVKLKPFKIKIKTSVAYLALSLVLLVNVYDSYARYRSVDYLSNKVATGYPSNEIVTTLKNYTSGAQKLYNTYNWGGYLIWHYGGNPKIFIDGRMPATWYQNDLFPFRDYITSNTDDKVTKFFQKYRFDLAIISKEDFVQEWLAKQNTWEKVYEDSSGLIYVKKT